MKRCATCNQTYTDDLLFCLSDGTPLIGLLEDEGEQQTVVLSTPAEAEQHTVVRSAPSGGALQAAEGSGSVFKYIAAVLGSLLVLVLIGAAAAVWILWPRNGMATANSQPKNDNAVISTASPVPSPFRTPDSPTNLNTDSPNLKDKEDELERERRRLADERKKIEDDKRLQTKTVEPEIPRFTDPGPARISFRRGSFGGSASGTVGRSRSFVLSTAGGQYLSATISSAGACVVFSGGSTSTGFTTGRGDTRLNIQNTCNRPSNFSLSVTVR